MSDDVSEHAGDAWVRLGTWHDRRCRLLKLRNTRETEEVFHGLLTEHVDFNGQEAADMLVARYVERGALPAGAHPMALWYDPSWHGLCLVVRHSSFAPVPNGQRYPVVMA
jgi:hypothetical protein